jgi:hypothetical protein
MEVDMTTTSQKHAELKALSKQGREAIYQMIGIAAEIIADTDYADQFGGQPQLIEHMEKHEFEHCGLFKLAQLLDAYRRFDKSVWNEHRYSLIAMVAMCQPKKEKRERACENWQSRAREAEAKLDVALVENEQLKKTISELHVTVSESREQIGELRGILKAREQRFAGV